MNVRTSFAGLGALAGALLLAACSSSEPAKPAESAPAPANTPPPAAAASSAQRVFFIEPTDGASVKSPVHFRFGSEGVTIAAVPRIRSRPCAPTPDTFISASMPTVWRLGQKSSRARRPGCTSARVTMCLIPSSRRDHTKCRSSLRMTST